MRRLRTTTLGCMLLLAVTSPADSQTLKTRWAARVTAENVHRDYPRPMMVRKGWVNLNGLWEFALSKSSGRPEAFPERILVPFPVESQLSGIGRRVAPTDTIWYRRTFQRPKGERVLLHFGASDWETRVWVNGKEVGSHRGGYDPFTFDITEALASKGSQEVVVAVKDPSDAGPQPRGKQVLKPEGIWYVPTSGIWQTVWLEAVPARAIDGLRVETANDGTLNVGITTRTAPGAPKARSYFTVEVGSGKVRLTGQAVAGGSATLKIPRPKLWSPETPHLYPIKVTWLGDTVESYVAFREVSLAKDASGQPRVHLNGKPVFLIGPLDQGFWPDGLYTAPSDEALKYDLEITKRLGFNLIRKHVKVESSRWYYHCDKMGLLVMQDMPSGDAYIGGRDPDINRTPESAAIFEAELKAMVDTHRNHPSIIAWVPYNEGWGQWDTARIAKWIKDYDPTRLVNSASGWTDRGVGDFHDVHVYPGPGAPPSEQSRALLLGEFGGLGLPTPGHMWRETGWGYQSFKTREELTARFVLLLDELRYLIDRPGLSGAVYTQTTDVETELNGLLTYDRAILKMDEKTVREAVQSLFLPPPKIENLVATSEQAGQSWNYRFDAPSAGWTDDGGAGTGWLTGKGGFGTPETPGAVVGTRWDTSDIWLRRTFQIGSSPGKEGTIALRIHHDDNVVVWIDGKEVFRAPGWTTGYRNIRIGSLSPGEHVIAIHCHQNSGGQFIDAGIVSIQR